MRNWARKWGRGTRGQQGGGGGGGGGGAGLATQLVPLPDNRVATNTHRESGEAFLEALRTSKTHEYGRRKQGSVQRRLIVACGVRSHRLSLIFFSRPSLSSPSLLFLFFS